MMDQTKMDILAGTVAALRRRADRQRKVAAKHGEGWESARLPFASPLNSTSSRTISREKRLLRHNTKNRSRSDS